jgi:N-methylhydantoinase A/oxoprolinase/acetone carboxylase beta subunit
MQYRLGIDVGGTNTDAVILDERDAVLAQCKRPTTADVSSGIKEAVDGVLKEGRVRAEHIRHAMLGTTHCTNAIVERRNLCRVGIVRLGAPSGLAIPPLTDWPADILPHVGQHQHIVHGGYEYNGVPLSPPDEQEIRSALEALAKDGIEALAVSGVFSPVNHEQEQLVRALAEERFGAGFPIALSSEIGSVSLLERENATILNAAISRIAEAAYGSFQDVLRAHGVQADLFITQNDGTLMAVEYARKYPVFTIASGPTNSLRGAAFLSGLRDAIVVDVGGTTTDVGILRSGFPRESTAAVEIGGVRTNFRMPDLISIGLGGGSLVVEQGGACRVGPQSVGFRITTESLVFGGAKLTATDVAVAAGLSTLGEAQAVRHLDKGLAAGAAGSRRGGGHRPDQDHLRGHG